MFFQMSATSAISSTDLNIFKKLSNPVVCDVEITVPSRTSSKRPRETSSDKSRESIQAAVAKAAASDDDDDDDDKSRAAPPKSNSLANAMETEKHNPKPVSQSTSVPQARPTVEKDDSSDNEEDPPSSSKVTVPKITPPASSVSAKSSGDETTEDRLEKQAYLIELQQLEKKGVALSRAFSMDDSIAELEFEVTKQNAGLSTSNSVAFMRDSLRLLISGVEVGNQKLGPFLSIDGWSSSVCQDMSRYDHALERVYKRYFRKQQLSPIIELAWLLIGSMVMFHVKNKIFGTASTGQGGQDGGGVGTGAGSVGLGGGIGGLLGMFANGFGNRDASNPAPAPNTQGAAPEIKQKLNTVPIKGNAPAPSFAFSPKPNSHPQNPATGMRARQTSTKGRTVLPPPSGLFG